jgi:hypothetical protein
MARALLTETVLYSFYQVKEHKFMIIPLSFEIKFSSKIL